jgi:hypothetical protein
MKIPLGDFLRKIVNPKSWLGAILRITKGSRISIGDHDIHLNEGAGPARRGESRFDRKPHRPAPPRTGGRP